MFLHRPWWLRLAREDVAITLTAHVSLTGAIERLSMEGRSVVDGALFSWQLIAGTDGAHLPELEHAADLWKMILEGNSAEQRADRSHP